MFFRSTGGITMYLWIFRLIFFCFLNPFPDSIPLFPYFSRSRESWARVWEVPHFAASWLSLCWLQSSVSLHLTYFPAFGVLVYEVWGVSFIPIHVYPSLQGWQSKGKQLGLGWAVCCSLCNGLEVTSLFCAQGLPVTGASMVTLSIGGVLPRSSPSLPSQAWHQPHLKTSG